MNSLERVKTVLGGGIPDRVPVSLHNFLAVGQFIGCDDIGELVQNSELMAQAQIACHHEIGHDMLQLEKWCCCSGSGTWSRGEIFCD